MTLSASRAFPARFPPAVALVQRPGCSQSGISNVDFTPDWQFAGKREHGGVDSERASPLGMLFARGRLRGSDFRGMRAPLTHTPPSRISSGELQWAPLADVEARSA